MLDFIMQPQVLGVLALIVVTLIGLWGKKFITVFRVAFQAWDLAQQLGILTGLSGYEKLAVAMTELQDKFFEKFGREPKANEEGWAVKIFNILSKLGNKENVEDFLEPLPEDTVTEA
jgi:hypothetical protein